MNVIVLLLIASISVAALFLAGFIWSVKSGQYKDEISPPTRILFDGDEMIDDSTKKSKD
ncbi:cbb3-type cytochrome oxidase assembly protein CcoS [Filimonas effusa]|uniref:Cbb3-type cytochrome oxidase assembly protein CcoS n=1 Tax=Filimonas effusa TaxID=2508721 RepID=A0A4Q1D4T0_9BACT|nr:cbb3-type cytochrome oxidase assembly protein CcoS [Filimonas effusa]RXK83465.1 cbb3-type cytochrome oxidase assembly protein CcoS [Filimonas effusa]